MDQQESEVPVPISDVPKYMTCFDEVFDWLSLKDIHEFGRACKNFQQYAGRYFNQNYLAADVIIGPRGIRIPRISIRIPRIRTNLAAPLLNTFCQFTPILSFENWLSRDRHEDELKRYRFVQRNCGGENSRIRKLIFHNERLTAPKIDCIKAFLHRVEYICIRSIEMEEGYHDLLRHCDNLKRLTVINYYDREGDRDWLLKEYPKLERLEWTMVNKNARQFDELKVFFQRHQNLRSFGTTDALLRKSADIIMESGIKLIDLAIDTVRSGPRNIDEILDQINLLYKRGVFKRLHLYSAFVDSGKYMESISKIRLPWTWFLEGAMVNVGRIPEMSNLTVLSIEYAHPIDCESFAKNAINLRRVYLGDAETRNVLPFIQYSPKLKCLKVRNLHRNPRDIIPLFEWNKERAKLADAQKVTFYLEEQFYLAAKWSLKTTNFSLIELRRGESYDFKHYFVLNYKN